MNPPEREPSADSETWHALARRILSRAEEFVYSRGIRGFDAQDLALEALAEAWRYYSERGIPVPTEEELAPLVLTIARRKTIDFLRRRARGSESPPKESVSEPPPDPLLVDALETALASLSPFERQVIELHVLHRLTYSEISLLTEVSMGSVRAAASRATRLLRALLQD